MKILAFETSTKLGSIALIENGVATQAYGWPTQEAHSEVLHKFIQKILDDSNLQLSDIDYFASGCGPGSFTGIRVALNTAKSFSYAFQKPMVIVDSLINLAYLNQGLALELNKTKGQKVKVLSLINAYKNMCYYALYDVGLDSSGKTQIKVQREASVIPVKDIKVLLDEPVLAVGDGYVAYQAFLPENIRAKLLRPDEISDYPTATSLGLLAADQIASGLTLDWKSTKPLYIRSSEAEETKRGIDA